ncbi:sulfite exporter TauE/SafE family protein [Desulfitobacterium sp.]|uniref:sulfite exporter TauE/SafE family protein n=1 Tax=Desulfitobacterium sp. TaxID=49981 RepID=UPI002B20D230|nr:sulfite exporter TauE/SafE family protein [Desulfitobacterium sp.]MEA4900947.1 sulfite exporter TauE/SafE family protein [Desulfitobacterium sp.]
MNTFALILIVLVASTLQAATGFGFAIMAIPFLLLLFESHDAIQLNIILSLIISLLMIYRVRHEINIEMLKRLTLGSLVGIIPGLILFILFDVRPLKMFVSIVIIAIASLLVANIKFKQSNIKELFVGAFSGFLTTSIGMPGPPLMIYFAGARVDKATIRATTVAYFVVVSLVSLALQFSFYNTSVVVWRSTLWSIPCILVGTLLGQWIFTRMNQRLLQKIIYLLLFFTGIYLLISTLFSFVKQ